MSEEEILEFEVPFEQAGKRLDQVLAGLAGDYSRSRLQSWIKSGRVTVDGEVLAPRAKLAGGERLRVNAEADPADDTIGPEPVPLDILYEDEHILVINKPAGLVMHPAAGNRTGTVQNGLLHYDAALAAVPRAGIVHRLDKDTTGLFVVAKTLQAHKSLVEQLQQRSVSREYLAIVNGTLVSGATVDAPIGRHPNDRKRMAVRENGKEAITHYRLAEKYRAHTLITVRLETGRTHQIRVHLSHSGHPLLGDLTYGGKPRFPRGCDESLREAIRSFRRQALHAFRLSLVHPASAETMSWEAPVPQDMQAMCAWLAEDVKTHG
ncbi:23S rRNA pseudouridine(1911/1915/1917) synthase RluD [Granulosicoccaceae sp. 1_MG-2023]|nr:23S rRNA pseudouridine(1911/1915/1917) synthase RluD [Granulosicoccaceae sp. 1_MG-2023]